MERGERRRLRVRLEAQAREPGEHAEQQRDEPEDEQRQAGARRKVAHGVTHTGADRPGGPFRFQSRTFPADGAGGTGDSRPPTPGFPQPIAVTNGTRCEGANPMS